jgi:outer membrane protein assembly factor BamB
MKRLLSVPMLMNCAVASALLSCDPMDVFRCDSPQDGNWTRYGRDSAGTHCAKLENFKDARDVAGLKQSWEISGLPGATNTPTVKNGVAYFGDWGGTLRAVDVRSGAAIWETTIAPGAPIRSTPTIVGNAIYAAFATLVAAYDLESGAPLWVQEIESHPQAYIESSPIFVDGKIVVGVASYELTLTLPDYTFRGSVVALDAATGAEQWRFYTTTNDATSGAGMSVWSSATVDSMRKLFFIGTGNAYEAPAGDLSDSVIAINYETGGLVWHHQFTAGDIYTVSNPGSGVDGDIGATPTLLRANGRDLLVVGSKQGIFKALDRDTGAEVWTTQLNKASDVGGIMTSAATAHGVLYVNSNNWIDFGFLHGEHSVNDTSTTFAIDGATGTVLWKRDLPAPMFGALSIANGLLFQGVIDGNLIALDIYTGAERWRDKLPGPIGAGVSFADGAMFVSYGFTFFKADPGQEFPSGVRAYR